MSDDMQFNKAHVPRHSVDAEQSCLGSCLVDPAAFEIVSELVTGAKDFYRESHQIIYSAMLALAESNNNIDLITVSNYLRNHGQLESCGGSAYLDGLIDIVPSSAHVRNYATIVADTAVERRLQQAGNSIARLALEGEEEADDKVDLAEEIIFDVSNRQSRAELLPIKSSLQQTFDTLYDRFINKVTVTGVQTGFTKLDEMTGGLQPANLVIIGARPSMGKTAFALSLAINVALNPQKPGVVAIFSLEMSREELCQRILCSVSRVSGGDVRNGNLKDDDWQRIARAINVLNEAALYIDDQFGTTVLDMKSKLRRLQKRVGLDLVVIDYLGLIRSVKPNANRVNEISEISRQLKGLAKELHVPIVVLSQLSRSNEKRDDKRPQLADLRDSGAIEQDADIVAFIHRDAYYNKETQNTALAEIIIAKQRNGPIGNVELSFVSRYATFYNLAKENAQASNFRRPTREPVSSNASEETEAEFSVIPL